MSDITKISIFEGVKLELVTANGGKFNIHLYPGMELDSEEINELEYAYYPPNFELEFQKICQHFNFEFTDEILTYGNLPLVLAWNFSRKKCSESAKRSILSYQTLFQHFPDAESEETNDLFLKFLGLLSKEDLYLFDRNDEYLQIVFALVLFRLKYTPKAATSVLAHFKDMLPGIRKVHADGQFALSSTYYLLFCLLDLLQYNDDFFSQIKNICFDEKTKYDFAPNYTPSYVQETIDKVWSSVHWTY